MALDFARTNIVGLASKLPLVVVLALGLFSGGCAQMGVPEVPSLLASNADGAQNGEPLGDRSDLQTATAYWGQKFQQHPRDFDNAMNYAKNLKAMGNKQQALAVLQRASIFHGDNKELASEYGRLAVDLGQIAVAEKVLALADDPGRPDWRVINARGTAMAKQGQYEKAIPMFTRALQARPNQPSILNNLALAHAMNGDPKAAETLLRQAVAQGNATKKVRQNLALVLGLQGKYDEATQVSARDVSSAQAAADTSVIRNVVGLAPQAIPVQPTTQIASGLKPTTQDLGRSSDGWSTAVSSVGN